MRSHRPFPGVLEVIRWFQMQPRTFVGLNTGRPEALRGDTLRSLNALGAEYRVAFASAFLTMNAKGWEQVVARSKVAAIERLRRDGYRIIAFVDNEPENLRAVADADATSEIVLLHADTLFQSARSTIPRGTPRGNHYVLTELITEQDLPQRIPFVWHGVNNAANLERFLASDVHWAEVDVRLDPRTGESEGDHRNLHRLGNRPFLRRLAHREQAGALRTDGGVGDGC